MSSPLIPGMGSFGNPAGMAIPGTNPNTVNQTFQQMSNIIPTVPKQNAVLGNSSVNPVVPQNGNTGGTGLNFGYNAAGGPQGLFNASVNLNPATYSGNGASDGDLFTDLKTKWGDGTGAAIYNTLNSGSGFNNDVASAMMGAMTPYFQNNMVNLMDWFGATGNRFSSTAALAGGKATADFSAQQQQLLGNMYMWAYNNYLNLLSGSKVPNQQTSGWETIRNVLGLAGTAGGAMEAAGIGANGGTMGAIAGGLAAL